MIIEDITQQAQPKIKKSQPAQPKVLLKEFDTDAQALAVLGKRIYRAHTCLDEMFPSNDTILYRHVFRYLVSMPDEHAKALKGVGTEPTLRRRLLHFVSLWSSTNPYLVTLPTDELWCFCSTP